MKWEKEKEKEKGVKGESQRERYEKEQRESDSNIERKREIGRPKKNAQSKTKNQLRAVTQMLNILRVCPRSLVDFLYSEYTTMKIGQDALDKRYVQ